MSVIVRSEDVALAIVERLLTIRIANGYETDIGRDVQQGRRKVPADDEPPCVQLVEGNDEIQDSTAKRTVIKIAQPYVIDAFDVCDPVNPNTQAHKMIRDIKRAFFGANADPLRVRLYELNYLGKDIGPRPDGAGFVQARVMIEVVFAEDLSAP